MSAEEAKEYGSIGCLEPGDAPKFPWGLELRLCNESLTKLGMSELPKVGSKVMVVGFATVNGVTVQEEQDGEQNRHVTLQITDLAVESAGTKSPEQIAKSLYPEMDN